MKIIGGVVRLQIGFKCLKGRDSSAYISNDVVTDGRGPILFSGAVVENQRKSVGFSPECSGEHQEYFH